MISLPAKGIVGGLEFTKDGNETGFYIQLGKIQLRHLDLRFAVEKFDAVDAQLALGHSAKLVCRAAAR